jgi:hypothetical protein
MSCVCLRTYVGMWRILSGQNKVGRWNTWIKQQYYIPTTQKYEILCVRGKSTKPPSHLHPSFSQTCTIILIFWALLFTRWTAICGRDCLREMKGHAILRWPVLMPKVYCLVNNHDVCSVPEETDQLMVRCSLPFCYNPVIIAIDCDTKLYLKPVSSSHAGSIELRCCTIWKCIERPRHGDCLYRNISY